MEFDNGYEYLKQEITELIDEIEQVVLSIERMGHDSASITALFRLVHTLKGSCGSFGFTKTANMIHTTEHLLDLMRSGVCTKSSDFLALMLDVCDIVKETFQYDYSQDEDPLEQNSEAIESMQKELSKFHASVHIEVMQQRGQHDKTTVILTGEGSGKGIPHSKPSQYEQLLKYRGILDSFKDSNLDNSMKLITTTVGSFKKSLLEQLRDSKSVSFDFSSIRECDEAGLAFLRAIPQIVKTKGANLDIRGVSNEIYTCAQEHKVHLKKILGPYIRTAIEGQDDFRDLQVYQGTIIVTTFGVKALSSDILTEIFLNLERSGLLNVDFSMGDIPLLYDENGELICKWEFTIETTSPRADIEAILCKLPPEVFWDWKIKQEKCDCKELNALLEEWNDRYLQLMKMLRSCPDKDLQNSVIELDALSKKVTESIDSPLQLSVEILIALYEAVYVNSRK